MQLRSSVMGVNWPGAVASAQVAKGAAACVAVAALAVLVANGAAVPSDCRSQPVPIAFGGDIETSMTVRAGRACPVWALQSSARIDALQIIAAPSHGQLTSRGRTGVIYRPNAGFRGEDVFAFALQGRSQVEHGTAVVRVRATVR